MYVYQRELGVRFPLANVMTSIVSDLNSNRH